MNKVRSVLFALAKLLGDVNAIQKGKIAEYQAVLKVGFKVQR